VPKHILVVDDETGIRDALGQLLRDEGWMASTAATAEEALAILAEGTVDVLLSDIRMPGSDGMELLRRVRDWHQRTAVVMMTAYASVETAVEALRLGAADYLLKPLRFEELLLRLQRLVEHQDLLLERAVLRRRLHDDGGFESFIGAGPSMQRVFDLIRRIAPTTSNVLITGRSGTGKELAAKAIHALSPRRHKIFLPINCGAISETLIESELFGHKRGAFTDAVQDKAGVFQLADGGTLFLDEVAEIPLHLQVKLLRALDDQHVVPVGGSTPVPVDVRIVSATNQDLAARVQGGLFREDLYYRLNVVEIHLPALDERPEDIPLLAAHFLRQYAAEMRKPILGIADAVLRALAAHAWRGGVRELENVIERAVIFCDTDTIGLADLPPAIAPAPPAEETPVDLRDALRRFEREHIAAILQRSGGNKEQAAKTLGIGLSSMYRKMEELGIIVNRES
jgi:DNA-binding NtrC family response regulator